MAGGGVRGGGGGGPPGPGGGWVEVVDSAAHDRVVTAIEVLSPGNKAAGVLNLDDVRKVLDHVRAGVNVVEIDLLRRRATALASTERYRGPARRI